MSDAQPVSERITRLARRGERFYLCITVVGELYFAVYASKRRRHNMANLERLLERIAVLDCGMSAANEFGQVQAELKAKGRPIPGTDAQIAAIARLHDLTVLSADRHFQHVENLRVENWL
jgi:tRNA(fMet)-specific endonuclease VapC